MYIYSNHIYKTNNSFIYRNILFTFKLHLNKVYLYINPQLYWVLRFRVMRQLESHHPCSLLHTSLTLSLKLFI